MEGMCEDCWEHLCGECQERLYNKKVKIYLVEYGSEHNCPFERFIFKNLENAKEKAIQLANTNFKDDTEYINKNHFFNKELFKISKSFSGEYIAIYQLKEMI